MIQIELKIHLLNSIRRSRSLIIGDLQALNRDQASTSPGGKARPAVHFVSECGYVNGMIADFCQSGEIHRLSLEEKRNHLASFDTVEKAINYLSRETDRLLEAVEHADLSNLSEACSPLGRMMSRLEVLELPAMHMMYHDGQLNYIQSLHGDEEIHWGKE